MPAILSAASALPTPLIRQAEIQRIAPALFPKLLQEHPELLRVYDNADIAQRALVMPLSWYLHPHGTAECNRIYREQGLELAIRASRQALEQADVAPQTVDHIIFVSTTGLATPSLDATLIARLNLRRDVSRLPIWGLGCAGGAAGLARALDYARAYPRARVLLVAMECCSLTLLHQDASRRNLIATALFGDGAAAVLVGGPQAVARGRQPQLVAARSYLLPDSEAIMGWEVIDAGLRLQLSPRLPLLIRQQLPALAADFFRTQGLPSPAAIRHHLVHPGGIKVLQAYAAALDLPAAATALSHSVLRDFGNLSSVSVLMVLERWLGQQQRQPGAALLSAFGPGFSAELLLLETT